MIHRLEKLQTAGQINAQKKPVKAKNKKEIALSEVPWWGKERTNELSAAKRANVNSHLPGSYEASVCRSSRERRKEKKPFNLFVWFRLVLYSYLTKNKKERTVGVHIETCERKKPFCGKRRARDQLDDAHGEMEMQQ